MNSAKHQIPAVTFAVVLFAAACACAGIAFAADTHSGGAHAQMSDAQSIEHAMKAQFDKPDAPLKVMPISIDGQYAVAGWLQNDRGGRAFLRKTHGKWSIEVCAGDALASAELLTQMGLPKTQASRLASRVQTAEKKLPPADVAKFALFGGVVNVKGDAGHGNGAHGTPH